MNYLGNELTDGIEKNILEKKFFGSIEYLNKRLLNF